MRKAPRLNAILERVNDARSVDVAELAGTLGVSEATIRRDLQSLSSGGLLVRTHGGAIANDLDAEIPTQIKAVRRQTEKSRIGAAGAALVPDGAVIGMSGGTTTLELARALVARQRIAIVTNALNIGSELIGRAGLHLVVIGGVARPSGEMVGPAAEAMLGNYHLDMAFIGVDGLTAEHGCTTYDEMEAQTDRAFLSQASRAVVLADHSKLGLVRFAQITGVANIHQVVTDRDASPAQLESLRAAGVDVVTV
ncbi:DeoR/GlpR family DNA-binding transcription regulator [Cryptosporangium phraense]|uniref:DeoR/GlpR family DNA-binding transcription regulator n=1 Tax=Cryptosporangium phraense TaxID=2593070 RepID=UPI00197AE7FE|nr:DeoR/GlpR family DNA-binding transcription regulator [Cryptosporangium phraense]